MSMQCKPCTILIVSVLAFTSRLAFAQTILDPNLGVETVVSTGLSQPTAMVFLGQDDLLIAEKASGQVKRVTGGVVGAVVLDLPVSSESERGLLGLALHPGFAGNQYVYLYYSRAVSDGATFLENRVSRFTWTGTALVNETVIVAFPSDPNQSNGPNHDGGVILFGPDGKLYGVTGDLNRNRMEQNNRNATMPAGVGGVFRLNDDGTVPTDNPFYDNAHADLQRLFAYGVRNSFGMAFDPVTSVLWDTENGPATYDEINIVASGFNSGWNKIMGPDSRDPQGQGDLVMLDGSAYSDPEFSYLNTIGITSIAFMNSTRYAPAYRNSIVVGDANFGELHRFQLNEARDGLVLSGGNADLVADDSMERSELRIGTGFSTTTDLEIGPDGYLYQLGINGRLRRIIARTPNDECANATLVSDGAYTFTTAGATASMFFETCYQSPQNDFGADIWFRYAAECRRRVTISLCGSSFDTALAVYGNGCPSGNLTALACSDDFCRSQSEITFTTPLVGAYYIRVGGDGRGDGTMTITSMSVQPGDLNCDCAVNTADVGPMALALIDPAAYAAQFPSCDIGLADVNGDLTADADDLQPFVDCVLQGVCAP